MLWRRSTAHTTPSMPFDVFVYTCPRWYRDASLLCSTHSGPAGRSYCAVTTTPNSSSSAIIRPFPCSDEEEEEGAEEQADREHVWGRGSIGGRDWSVSYISQGVGYHVLTAEPHLARPSHCPHTQTKGCFECHSCIALPGKNPPLPAPVPSPHLPNS